MRCPTVSFTVSRLLASVSRCEPSRTWGDLGGGSVAGLIVTAGGSTSELPGPWTLPGFPHAVTRMRQPAASTRLRSVVMFCPDAGVQRPRHVVAVVAGDKQHHLLARQIGRSGQIEPRPR